jgi:two-component system LytT family sensor kinase
VALWRRSRTLVWLALWTGIGLFFASQAALSDALGQGWRIPWTDALLINLPFYWLWAIFALPALGAARRFAIEPPRRWRHLGIHLVLALALASAHLVAAEVVFELLRWLRGRQVAFVDGLGFSFRNNFHVDVLTYWAVVAMSHLRAYDRGVRERRLTEARLREQLVRAELGALRMQLHPHFLFNALNSITAVLHRDPEQAESMIVQLSRLLRRALETRDTAEVPLAREVEMLRNYFELASLRHGERLRWRIDVPPVLAGAMVPTFLLQPLVENAVVHGIESLPEAGSIAVRARQQGARLELEVENDAPAEASNGRRAGAGVGLENVRARLRHLYGDDASFELAVEPGASALARIVLPYREDVDLTRRTDSAPHRGMA